MLSPGRGAMAVLIASPAAGGKPARAPANAFCRLISAGNCCTSTGMSDEEEILAANAAYYDAFAAADFAAMSRIWAEDDVSCIHPGWPALIGRPSILESYRQILSNPNQERIEPRNETVIVAGERGARTVRGIRRRGGARRDQYVRAYRWRVADDPSSGEPDRRAG